MNVIQVLLGLGTILLVTADTTSDVDIKQLIRVRNEFITRLNGQPDMTGWQGLAQAGDGVNYRRSVMINDKYGAGFKSTNWSVTGINRSLRSDSDLKLTVTPYGADDEKPVGKRNMVSGWIRTTPSFTAIATMSYDGRNVTVPMHGLIDVSFPFQWNTTVMNRPCRNRRFCLGESSYFDVDIPIPNGPVEKLSDDRTFVKFGPQSVFGSEIVAQFEQFAVNGLKDHGWPVYKIRSQFFDHFRGLKKQLAKVFDPQGETDE